MSILLFAGCDLGAVSTSVVLIEDDTIRGHETIAYRRLPREAAMEAMERLLAPLRLRLDQIEACLATGVGRKVVPFAQKDVPETISVGRAVRWLHPEVRTVIDAGGQKIRTFHIDPDGRVTDSSLNEKCASGTGKFIEVMAKALDLSLGELSVLPFEARAPVPITSQCGVFAESEVISHVNEGRDRADIVAGVCRSVALRIASLVRGIGLERELAMVGGVAKNAAVVKDLEEEVGSPVVRMRLDAQIIGALGAALVARDRHGFS